MLLELKNLFLEDGGKKDLHYEMDLSQVVFSGVRPFITPVSVTAQAENRAGAIHLDVYKRQEQTYSNKAPTTALTKKMMKLLECLNRYITKVKSTAPKP